MSSSFRILAFLPLCILLMACQQEPLSMQERGPTRSVVTGSQRMEYDFFDAAAWDIFRLEAEQASFQVENGRLQGHVAADRGYIMSRNHVSHDDVIINATLRQTAGTRGSAFGVVCRADEDANGYYFLLSASGEFSISVGTAARDALFELIPWQYHSIIRPGFQANEIRAVCAEEYLAIFINDVFAAETTDYEFSQGVLGLTLGAVGEAASVEFDHVLVRDAILRGER